MASSSASGTKASQSLRSSRGSSRPSSQRPKLSRSAATAPSVVISNASRNDLPDLNTMTRASTYLNKLASYSRSPDDYKSLSPPGYRGKSASPRTRSPAGMNDDNIQRPYDGGTNFPGSALLIALLTYIIQLNMENTSVFRISRTLFQTSMMDSWI